VRTLASIAILTAACGGSHPARDAAAVPEDAVVDDAVSADSADSAVPDAMPPACNLVAGSTVVMREIASVDSTAVLVTSPPGDPRLFVVEQRGVIRIIENGVVLPAPFLDLSDDRGGPVVDGGEQGLLGLAFDPAFATTGELYVTYTSLITPTDNDPIDNLARYRVSATDRNVADPAGTLVLALPRSRPSHNGGMVEFGSDGYLYLGTGDGGSNGDPLRNGQNLKALHGKMLRLDVHQRVGGRAYGIPSDNPYADGVAGAPEIYMRGLRNPWRWSFDRATGDLWIGDVGQGQSEEIDVALAGAQAGKNFGWSVYEGNVCCALQADLCTQDAPQQPCDPTGKTFPLDIRPRASGWASIIGGQVYRGACYPDLVGWYFYTDFVKGGLAKARLRFDGTLEVVDLPGAFPAQPTSLHADARGELYETDATGHIYHLEVAP
jgi:glucose/arabinose dehydrogenase